MEETTLYERIGGSAVIDSLVDAFYQRVLTDPELLPLFENISKQKLEHMQREFFAAALDDPVSNTDWPMSHVHHGHEINPHHLSRFLDHLLATLKSRGLNDDDVYAIISRLNTYTDEITGGSSVDC
ncbi:MAG: hemoglobin [Verrucomicrobiales bacterium]|jgi:hemoglobin